MPKSDNIIINGPLLRTLVALGAECILEHYKCIIILNGMPMLSRYTLNTLIHLELV